MQPNITPILSIIEPKEISLEGKERAVILKKYKTAQSDLKEMLREVKLALLETSPGILSNAR